MSFKEYKKEVLRDPRSGKLNFETDGRNHYVYRISNKYLVYHYYGSKSEKPGIVVDTIGVSYFTSSNNNIFKCGFRNDPNDWEVNIVKRFDNPGDKVLFESYLHHLFDVKNHDNFINRANQTPFGFDTTGIPQKKPGKKPVYQVSLDTGKIVNSFESDTKASMITGISLGSINTSVNNLGRTAGKFIWCRPSDYNDTFKDSIIETNFFIKKPVLQINPLTGLILQKFESIAEATLFSKVDSAGIIGCMQLKNNTAGGFIWRAPNTYDKKEQDNILNFKYSYGKAVQQLDKDTLEIVNEFGSISAAARHMGVDSSAINNCVKNKCKTVKGFIWKYKLK